MICSVSVYFEAHDLYTCPNLLDLCELGQADWTMICPTSAFCLVGGLDLPAQAQQMRRPNLRAAREHGLSEARYPPGCKQRTAQHRLGHNIG